MVLAASSLFISCGGNRKLFRSAHSVTLQQSSSRCSISFILCGCLNPEITADKVSLNDGDDDDADDDDDVQDGERSIDI